MRKLLRDEVLEVLKSGRVDYVRVVFADILGNSRGRSLRRIEFEKSLNKGIEYSEALLYLDYKDTPIKQRYGDIFAVPDISTFVLIPYLERTARVLSFLTTQDNSPHPLCTRSLLTRSIDKLAELGYNIKVAFEPTFYLINFKDGKPVPADEARAFSSEGLMEQQNFLRDLIKYLESVNIQVQYINKHYAPGQYEITFSMGEALEEADSLITAREIIRDTARLYHLYSTFMPKPFKEYPSSSMDIYIKLVDTQNKSVGVDTSDPRGLGLSKILYSFLAGILEHISSILAIAAPTINSYKRYREVVTPNVAGIGNERHFIIRIPSTYRDLGVFEFRLADPLANPYLLLSSMIFAGIDGIEKGLDIDVNYEVSTLPTNLKEALYKLDSDTKLKYYLGKELVDTFIELKKKEIEDYEKEITEWEINSYLKSGW
ncbi:putative glutamine synthetase [Sulfurisphaera tokodaii str. 7]|uniref:Glutamine synthetase n=1 Tax=Sulfurisphaera tokodaii (strain DSM 16993 / JCM 10545 / NBRC 100140 / 7) TaxID=273063 RepID=F9VN35_SULTO|nr:putative glutamine synthetase [Sulfurisphaera tokodaii str. 7]